MRKMKKSLNRFQFFIAFILIFQPSFGQIKSKNKDTLKLSSVELQWEDSPGAFMYEVEVYNSKSKLLKSFVSKSSLFKFKSTSGKIKIRGRVLDAYGKKGLWSELFETLVPPDDMKFPEAPDSNKPIQASASNKSLKGRVTVNWPEGIQARRYIVKIMDKDNKVVQEKITTKLSETFELDSGGYSYSITPIGNDKVPGKEITAPQKILIGSAQLPIEKFEVVEDKNGLQIKMPNKPGLSVSGELEYANHLAENWTSEIKYIPFGEEIWSPTTQLKPGRYRIAFWLSKQGWTDSDKFTHHFVVKPTEAYILQDDPPAEGSKK